MRACLRVIAACCALLGAAAPIYAADGLALTASAGLGGLARPGRWVPVRVTVDARRSDVAADLVVTWGQAQVRRPVTLAAPSRKSFVLYIRTGDVRDSMLVRLQDHGLVLASAAAPVHLVDVDDQITLCIDEPAADCTTTVAAATLGNLPREFDVADEVRLADVQHLAPDQRDALLAWREARRLENTVDNAPALGTVPAAASPASHVWRLMLAYLLLIGAGLLVARRFRTMPLLVYPAVGAAVIIGSTAAIAAGRLSPVLVHHATLVEQFVGTPLASISSRGVAEFPGGAPGTLTWPTVDGAVEVTDTDTANVPDSDDAAGAPGVGSTDTVGATRSFHLEGFAPVRGLDVSRAGAAIRVTNVSGMTLEHCTWPAGFDRAAPASLPPAGFAETTGPLASEDPVVSCVAQALPIPVRHDRADVAADGDTLFALHLPPAVSP